ncbi:hypothetical protein ACJX0J_033861, partial [Zea mays]
IGGGMFHSVSKAQNILLDVKTFLCIIVAMQYETLISHGCMELVGPISIIFMISVRHHYIREAVASGWSDKSFTDLLNFLADKLPKGNMKKKILAKYIMLSLLALETFKDYPLRDIKRAIFVKRIQIDIVGGHAEIIHTERM